MEWDEEKETEFLREVAVRMVSFLYLFDSFDMKDAILRTQKNEQRIGRYTTQYIQQFKKMMGVTIQYK